MVKDMEAVKKYQDKEEIKQRRIIRQSCFKAACDTYKSDTKLNPISQHIENIINIAQAGERWILEEDK